MDIYRVLLAAQGYLELGMLDEAHAELGELDPVTLRRPEFLECRLFLCMQADRWNDGLELSRQLREVAPDEDIGYIQGAYCLHELGRTTEARELLLSAPRKIREESLYYYNMACYETVLGNLDVARDLLQRSFQLEEALRSTALEDRDLAPLRPWLAGDPQPGL